MPTHDLIDIGLGPYNLGLACLSEPLDDLDALFLEARPRLEWHPGMLLESVTQQTPFLADLVTLADPTSPYSFLAYLKERGPFYIRESFFPLRSEYDDYCRWAAGRLRSVRFGRQVSAVEHDQDLDEYVVRAVHAQSGERREHWTRHVVLGTGTTPHLPQACADLGGDALHTAQYLSGKAALQAKRSITIIGSGQSAAEVFRDLLTEAHSHDYQLTWITRSPRFFPLEYTKLTLEMTSPDYVDYFHALPESTRFRLEDEQKVLFKGINASLINAIYDLLYQRRVRGGSLPRLLTCTALEQATYDGDTGAYTLSLRQMEQDRPFSLTTEGLVLATGYGYRTPAFIEPVRHRIRWDSSGRYDVGRNYSIDLDGRRIFLQSAATHTHSVTSPDLGMGPYRNSCILREVLDREQFWAAVARCVRDYQESAPHLADRFAAYDLFAEEFPLSYLNRLQLRNNQHMLDLSSPADALQFSGTLANPLAPYALPNGNHVA